MPRRLWLLVSFLVLLAVMGGAWQLLAAAELLTPATVREGMRAMSGLSDSPWTVAIVLGLFVLGSLVVFPLSVLVAATGLIFGATWGFVYGLIGTILASVATYLAGWALGRETVKRYGGARLTRLSRALARRGLVTMIIISVLPIAPFTLTNMVAGAFHIRFRDYILGTVIGIAPGLLAMTVIGSQLGALLQAEDVDTVMWTVLVIAACVGALATGRHLAARRERRLLHTDANGDGEQRGTGSR